jgi:hypothetical protein
MMKKHIKNTNVVEHLFHENLPFPMIEQMTGVDRETLDRVADEWDDTWESINQTVGYDEQRSTEWFV